MGDLPSVMLESNGSEAGSKKEPENFFELYAFTCFYNINFYSCTRYIVHSVHVSHRISTIHGLQLLKNTNTWFVVIKNTTYATKKEMLCNA